MNIELKDLQQFRHKSGVYHLIKCDDDGIEDTVYIGQSRDIYTRILEHSYEKKKDFNFIKAIEIKNDDLRLLVETLFIYGFLNPLGYNKEKISSLDDLDLTLLATLYTNELYETLKQIRKSDSILQDKRTMLDFQHFYFYLFHKTKNNKIKLERDYLENEFLDYTLMIKRNINEYIKLYR